MQHEVEFLSNRVKQEGVGVKDNFKMGGCGEGS